MGLRRLQQPVDQASKAAAKVSLPQVKQYKDKDGLFYVKLVDGQGQLLLQSLGFVLPREAAQLAQGLQQGDTEAPKRHAHRLVPVDPALQSALQDALNTLRLQETA